tara:strand:+ start:8520 stop:8675 length:156 start_codon:yes stop_codon:yes gene_type:complete
MDQLNARTVILFVVAVTLFFGYNAYKMVNNTVIIEQLNHRNATLEELMDSQ